jgi:hypothetical protein
LRGLTIIDPLEPTRRGRITTIDNAGYVVTVQWAVGDVQRVNVTDRASSSRCRCGRRRGNDGTDAVPGNIRAPGRAR